MQLDEAEATDLRVTDRDVMAAQREADEAGELLAELERAAVEDPEPPSPSAVVEQRELGRFARLRVEHTRRRAGKAREARRLLALGEVAAEIDQVAAETARPDDLIGQGARKLALAAVTMRELCRQHDAHVQALTDRAAALGVEEPAPSGPRATSAHVALVRGSFGGPDGIAHGRTRVLILGDRVDQAIAKAAAGDAEGAAALVRAFHEQPEPARADRYYRSRTGQIVAESGPEESQSFREQVAAGELVPLTGREIDRYLNGVLDDA